MSNEVKLENVKPGMWAEFDIIENKKDIKTGHYLLELQSVPVKSVEDLMYLVLADALHGGRIIDSLGVDLGDDMIPIIDGKYEPMPYVENLHVYEEKPVSSDIPKDSVSADHIAGESGDAHDLSGIPTEPGLYRAATGSVWYYDGKSWTPITDHKGKYTYADKQSYKRFIETSLSSHRVPFTPISLQQSETDDPEVVMPTTRGWYEDKDGDAYWFDGETYKSLTIERFGVYTADEATYYAPYKPIPDIEAWLKQL